MQQWIESICKEQNTLIRTHTHTHTHTHTPSTHKNPHTHTYTHTCYFELQLLTKLAVGANLAAEIVGAYRRRFESVGRRGRQFLRFREITFVQSSFARQLVHVVKAFPFKYNLSGCFAIRFHNHVLFSFRHHQFPVDDLSQG